MGALFYKKILILLLTFASYHLFRVVVQLKIEKNFWCISNPASSALWYLEQRCIFLYTIVILTVLIFTLVLIHERFPFNISSWERNIYYDIAKILSCLSQCFKKIMRFFSKTMFHFLPCFIFEWCHVTLELSVSEKIFWIILNYNNFSHIKKNFLW